MPKFTLQLLLCCALCFVCLPASGQVTASFIASDTAGCAPFVVSFTSTSAGATSYTWDLGNGTPPSGFSTASTAYTATGTYTVTLTASDGTTTSTSTQIIRVYAIPTVSFFATSDTSVCAGTPVSFSSTSTPGSWGFLTYTWNFGDGGSSVLSAPSHSYSFPGFYNVTLFATNAKGCINSYTVDDYVDIFTPAAISFHAPTIYCKPPAAVTFVNTTTGTGALAYTWKYGDGGTSVSISPAHTYTAAGIYAVSLKVTDGNGCTDSVTDPAYINVGSLAAGFTASPATVCIGPPVTFTNTSASFISSNWNFGDGSTSTALSPVHSYTAAGTYTVRLIAYNGGTCYDTITHSVTVLPSPTGSFTISPAEPCLPSLSTLTASIPAGCTVSWIFSDTTTASGTPVTHNFHWSKVYSIDMIIANSIGCKDTVKTFDTVYNLIWSLGNTYPQDGCAPLTVGFAGNATSIVHDDFLPARPDSLFITYPYAIASYSWNFGDGSPGSSAATPVHTYTAIGSFTFTPTCTIITANGCTATSEITITDGVVPAIASFSIIPRHACAGQTTTFSCTATGSIDQYYWSFGDFAYINGMGPTYRTVTHLDSVAGMLAVTLAVYDNGCVSVPYTLMDTIDAPGAEIDYNYTCIPKDGIAFTDASLGDDTHTWLFGDGTTSTLANPVHDYPALAAYTAKLATYNIASGCRDTASASFDLTSPIVYFISDSVNICRDKLDTFVSTITGSYPVVNYRWYDNNVLVDSTDANLAYTFHVRGLQTISLVITDDHNCLDTFTRTAYINVAKPIDNYSITPGFGCAPLAVNFSDLSTDVAGIRVNKYFWSFGDGDSTNITASSIVHTYTASGTYTVKERVIDTLGCMDSLTTSTLTVNRPRAGFTIASTTACANTSVHFNNVSTGYTSSLWSFGDGTTSAAVSPDHVYTAPGIYTIRLVVYSSVSCTDTVSLVSYLTVLPSPVASFYMNDSFAVCPPLNVSFFNTSTSAVSAYWILGDGSYSHVISPGDIYISPGIYTVKLAAINSYGCADTAVGHASIFGYSGAVSYVPLSGCSPLPVHFSTVLTSAASVIWDFGDGVTSLSASDTINHTYRAAGSYIPKLILTDTTGCTSFSLGADTIKVDTVTSSFTAAPNPGCVGIPISFGSTSASYFSAIVSQTWTFLPGVTSALPAPVYTYSLSGAYPVTLSSTDGKGCVGTITRNVTVSAPPPAITGVFSLCAGASTTLSDPGGTWSVSGTSVATIGSASGIVNGVARGTATVTFTAATGCSVTAPVTVNPSPGAISGASGICLGLTAAFTDATSGGTWSSSNTSVATAGPTGVITAVLPGTATISYSFGGGSCAATKTVTVSASPTLISGPSAICAGAVAIETNGVTGGTWTSSNTAAATVDSTGGMVRGIAPGTTTITYSAGAGCTTSKIMTVNASPVAVSGSGTVCQGLTIRLFEGTTGGIWSCSPAGIATIIPIAIGIGNFTGLAPGTDTVFYTAGGCSASWLVTVYATPLAITGPAAVCAGSSITLTDAITGGTWTSSNTTVATISSGSGIVSGIAPAVTTSTTSITYSLASGCAVTAAVTVNIGAAPIAGTLAVCSGAATALLDATTGGVWSAAPAGAATVTGAGMVTGIAAGVAGITYTPATGCAATATVTVNPLPAAITGSVPVCAGSAITLGSVTTGGAWNAASGGIAIADPVTGRITGVSAGVSAVTYTLPGGCSTAATVTVNPIPAAITGNMTMCIGAATVLSDSTGSGVWATSNAATAPVSGIGVVSGAALGTATISYTVGGCPVIAVVTINSLPAPIGGVTSVCAGSTITLTDATGGGVWSSSSAALATADLGTGIVTGVSAGVATINYSLGAGCTVSAAIVVNPLPAAIGGIAEVCAGYTTTLSDATGGGVWSSSNPALASVTSAGLVTGGAAGGLVTVYYTNPTTGCAANRVISVVAVPPIAGVGSMCAFGPTMTVSDAITGGVWTSTSASVSSAGVVSAYSAGAASITYTLSLGCYITAAFTIHPEPGPVTGASSFCLGHTTTLSDTSTTGTWSSSNAAIASVVPAGTGSAVVTGFTAGSVIISYTVASGCSETETITVDTFPSAGTITGPSGLCVGTIISLTDPAASGVWSSSNASAGVSGGIVAGVYSGIDTIQYIASNACGTVATAKVITVNPLPVAGVITGLPTVCTGDSITLSDAAGGGVWSVSNASASVSGGMVRGVAAGIDTVRYSVTNSCGTADTAMVIIINTLPGPGTISGGTDSICAGAALLLADAAATGGVWSSSNGHISITGAGLLTALTAGADTITYSITNGCGTVTASVAVAVKAAYAADTITGNTTVCIGATDTLTGTPPGGAWNSSNGNAVIVSTGAEAIISGVSAGADTIIYSTVSDCGGVAAYPITVFSVNDCNEKVAPAPTGSPQGGEVLRVWPNPNDGVFTVILSSAVEEEVQVAVTNIVGEKVKVMTTVANKVTEIKLDNAAGVYFVTAITTQGSYVAKVTVE